MHGVSVKDPINKAENGESKKVSELWGFGIALTTVGAIGIWGSVILYSIMFFPIGSELHGERFFEYIGFNTLVILRVRHPSRFEERYAKIGYWMCFLVSLILAATMMALLAMNYEYCNSNPYSSDCSTR